MPGFAWYDANDFKKMARCIQSHMARAEKEGHPQNEIVVDDLEEEESDVDGSNFFDCPKSEIRGD